MIQSQVNHETPVDKLQKDVELATQQLQQVQGNDSQLDVESNWSAAPKLATQAAGFLLMGWVPVHGMVGVCAERDAEWLCQLQPGW